MTQPGVFISHSRLDNVAAEALAGRLREWEYTPFLDIRGIPGGAQWEQALYDALRRSLAIVLCATPDAVTSQWVFAEVAIARFTGVRVIPVIVRTCELPEFLSGTTQVLDLTADPDAGYGRLHDALDEARRAPGGTSGSWRRKLQLLPQQFVGVVWPRVRRQDYVCSYDIKRNGQVIQTVENVPIHKEGQALYVYTEAVPGDCFVELVVTLGQDSWSSAGTPVDAVQVTLEQDRT